MGNLCGRYFPSMYRRCDCCNEYKKNLIDIGEKKNNIFNYGSLAVDAIQNTKIIKREILFKKLNLDHKLSTVILTYHPVTLENKLSENIPKFSIYI